MQVSSLVSFGLAAVLAGLFLIQPTSGQQQQQQQQVVNQQQQPTQQEPENRAEPYSFSYNAESLGGMSSHQESGDGRGRVQGFYTIMGEDGRERRVDYVADENGYRASISTNEVGMRSESSADAQFKVQSPSQGQLDQAKVTAQEYEYLESTHASERQRHLKQLSSNAQPQQQQHQQFDANSRWQQSGGFSQNSARQQQQTESFLQDQRNSSEDGYEGWRRGKSLDVQSQAVSTPENRPQNQLPAAASSSASLLISSATTPSEFGLQSGDSNSQQSSLGSSASFQSDSESSLSSAAGYEQVPQRHQAHQAAWQMTSRGALPARKPLVTVVQRQIEAQFMQQANQLTEQDYPRQPTWSEASQQFNAQQRGQQQQQIDQQQVDNLNQFQQQQNNIIDEVAGEQLEPMQPLVSVGEQQQQQEDFRFNITATKRPVVAVQPQQIQQQKEQEQFVAYIAPTTTTTTTTTSTTTTTPAPIIYTNTTTQAAPLTQNATITSLQPTPSGFLAINLQNQDTSSELTSDQNLDQEVDSERPASGFTQGLKQIGREQLQQQTTGQVKGAQKTTSDFQRVDYNQQQQSSVLEFRPNSIKQIIESQTQQPQQQQQQQREEQRITSTTPAAIVQTEVAPTKTSVFQQAVTREPAPVTTKQTTSQQHEQTSTTARAPYIQETLIGGDFSRTNQTQQEDQQLEMVTTRRPAVIKQQQQAQQNVISRGQAGAFFSQRQRGQYATGKAVGTKGAVYEFARPTTSYIQPQAQRVSYQAPSTSITYQPSYQKTSLAASTSTRAPQVDQQEFKSVYQQRPEAPASTTITTTAKVPTIATAYQQRQQANVAPGASLELNNERFTGSRQEQVIEKPTTSAPARPTFKGVDRNTQLQQQIQALKAQSGSAGGVKGASSKLAGAPRRQFWQPLASSRQEAAQQLQQAPQQLQQAPQQLQQAPQPRAFEMQLGGRPSVDYANSAVAANAATAASSSSSSVRAPANTFGTRIQAGR